MEQSAVDAIMAGLGRIEAVLRAAYRQALETACPDAWAKGRRRRILEFCGRPRTQQQIRDHVGSIAGYEVKQYLDEGQRCGVLASFGAEGSERYLTVLPPPAPARRKKPSVQPRKGRDVSA